MSRFSRKRVPRNLALRVIPSTSRSGSTERPEISTEDTTITLSRSEDRVLNSKDDYLDPENLRRHGWCTKEGTPWSISRPKDEADLLRGGLLKLSGEGSKDFPSPPHDYFDEVELKRKGLVSGDPYRQRNKSSIPEGRSKMQTSSPSYYGQTNLSAENYITDAELNTRGYIDRFNQIHYSIPIVLNENETKRTSKAPGHVTVSSERSERSIRNYTPNIKSEPKENRRNVCGSVTYSVGDDNDRGKLQYRVHESGRTYSMKCPDGRSIILTFSTKGAAIVTNRQTRGASRS